ncbi:MAG TPA: hypothetical protein VIB39_12990 [Candidatus Angelobacter sp.]
MKSVIVGATIMLSLAGLGFAADERSAPASPSVAADAKKSMVERAQPPASIVSSVSADAPAPASVASVTAASTMNAPAPAVLPAAPSALIVVKPQRPEGHRFFDLRNSFALSAVAVSLTADALSTQKGLSQPGFYEMNPLARPFVQSRAGAAVYSAGSLGLVAAGMYVAHRTHHHKLERILPFAIAGWEGMLSARNYHVIAANTR